MTDPLIEKYGLSRSGHAIFAPSASHRWLRCSGSLLANAVAGDTAGYEAAEGTVAHTVAEKWNKTGQRPDNMVGLTLAETAGGTIHRVEVTSGMLDYVGQFVQWCAEVPGDNYYEQRVDLSPVMPIPGQGGTADHIAIEGDTLTITDLKYGTGVRVHAANNPQLLLYALGAFYEWDFIYGFKRIVLRICQPRLDVYDVYECSREELLAFAGKVRERAKAAWDERAERRPAEEACRFCSEKAVCPARVRFVDDLVDATFEDECVEETGYNATSLSSDATITGEVARKVKAPITRLSTKTLSHALTFRKAVESWFKAMYEELLARVEKGEDAPFHKMVDGRKKYRWKDAAEVTSYLTKSLEVTSDDVAPRKIRTPTDMRKFLRSRFRMKAKELEEMLAPYVAAHAGKHALVPITDDRQDVGEWEEDMEAEDE